MVAFHANTTTYLQLTMQEVSSATTPALQQALWQQHSILPPRDRRRRRRLWPFRQPGLPFAEPSRRGSPRGVEWQEEGDRERAREREREEGREEERTPRKARLLLFLVAVVVHSGPSVSRRRRLCRRCKTRKATFSVLCEAALLSLSRRRTRTVGRTTQCCRLSLRPEHKGERAPSAARTQQRSTLRWKEQEPPERQKAARARLPAQLGRNAGGRGPDAEERREEGTYSSECEYAAHRDDKAKEVEDQVRATT